MRCKIIGPTKELADARKAAVKILTEDFGVLAPSVTGLSAPMRAVEVAIGEAGRPGCRLVIVHAHYPPLPTAACDELAPSLRRHFGGAGLYFTTADGEGAAEVYVPQGQGSADPFAVAAAVAVIKTCWGWDEVNPMTITIAGEAVRVVLAYDGHTWVALTADAS